MIKEEVASLMKAAMKSQDKQTLSFARNLHALIRKREIDTRVDLDDEGTLKIIVSSVKQRQESIDQFKAGNRPDLVEKEEAELAFLKGFLPQQLSESEIEQLIDQAIAETNSKDLKDLGVVMKWVSAKTGARADAKQVSQLIREKLTP